jgi:hypothetical protein
VDDETFEQPPRDEARAKEPEVADDGGGASAREEAGEKEAECDLDVAVEEVEDDLHACTRAD